MAYLHRQFLPLGRRPDRGRGDPVRVSGARGPPVPAQHLRESRECVGLVLPLPRRVRAVPRRVDDLGHHARGRQGSRLSGIVLYVPGRRGHSTGQRLRGLSHGLLVPGGFFPL